MAKVGRPTKYDPSMCEVVISLFKEGASKAEVCVALGIGFDAFQDYQKKYSEFSEAVKVGMQYSQAWWEKQGRIATFGGHEGFNATSYIFQMKNRFREDWRDKHEVEHSGEGITLNLHYTDD